MHIVFNFYIITNLLLFVNYISFNLLKNCLLQVFGVPRTRVNISFKSDLWSLSKIYMINM